MRAREFPAGTVVETRTGGGGGYGDPKARPFDEVLTDVRQGYVSVQAAWDDYGVRVPEISALMKQLPNRAARLDGKRSHGV